MISHFHYTPKISNEGKKSWSFQFFYRQKKHRGIYHYDGKIEWLSPDSENLQDKTDLESAVHDLMLFHIYEH
ncbi:DUF5342 family protein [Texcoconibacillus texcoconensis]|uniref:YheE family protein n=1 Tax=Texcoconibacillus texcoconensis TaxID=1095777 RepID=A0A840QPD3_9BACI|nr:DUF5342 family protein [Texcoconibacillus texcoconensis]MBB5173262.1 hypothetical protein [Texcoconibacillus texcoconensis]